MSGFVEVFSKLIGAVNSCHQEVGDVIAGDRHSVKLLTSSRTRGDEVLTADIVTALTWQYGKVIDGRIAVDPSPQTPTTEETSTPSGESAQTV